GGPRTALSAAPVEKTNGNGLKHEGERKEVPPIEPGKMIGNWNPGPAGPRPDLTPAPFGIPFVSGGPRTAPSCPRRTRRI
ncbi:MAG TPA: hypothetical protein VF771_07300, partial [Longimicrobiaceae bacterium]